MAVFSSNGHPAPKHPPGKATVEDLVRMVKAEVGSCRFGDWESFKEVGGVKAGWMATVRGKGVAKVAASLGEEQGLDEDIQAG